MNITNETTAWQIAELMGPEADETDGSIMLNLLIRDGVKDTDEVDWYALLDEVTIAKERDE